MPADITLAPPQQQIIRLMAAGHSLYRITTDLAVTQFRFELHTPAGWRCWDIKLRHDTVAKLIKSGLVEYGRAPARLGAPWQIEINSAGREWVARNPPCN